MAVNNAYVWRAAQDRLRQKTTNAQFETWLRGTQLVAVENGVAVLGAPTTFAKEQLETRFRSLIEAAIGEVMGARCLLTIEVLASAGFADAPTGGQSATSRAPGVGRGPRPATNGPASTPYTRPTLFDLDATSPSERPATPMQGNWTDSADYPGAPSPASPLRQRPAEAPSVPATPPGRGQRAAITTPLSRSHLRGRMTGAAPTPPPAAQATPPARWTPSRSEMSGARAQSAPTNAQDVGYADDDDLSDSADQRPYDDHDDHDDHDDYDDYGSQGDNDGDDQGNQGDDNGFGYDGDDEHDDEPAGGWGAADGLAPMGANERNQPAGSGYENQRPTTPTGASRYTPPGQGVEPTAPTGSVSSGYGGPYGLVAPRFNARYTFSTFIVGSGNRLAHAASQAVAEAPGYAYNPLFLYGGVGLGKTHLLHAIGHTALENNLTVLYVSSETFTNEIINAIRYRTTEDFRAKYRSVDVLLVDDIQFIAGKDSTEEEFFHTFNSLHETNKQIVMCSDRPPAAIVSLEDRLRSRFAWGLIADIQPPDLETRIAILQAKAEMMRRLVPDDVILFLASRVQSNIRELEGSLNRLLAFAQLQGAPLNVDTAKAALASLASDGRQRRVSVADILAAVADHYHLPADDLRGKQRDKHIVGPRQVAMYLMRQETEASLLEIGQALGGRDHSTVLHGCEKISREINENTALRKEVLAIRQKLLE